MKVVLDSNVLIAAFTSRGLCSDLLEVCLVEHRIILSDFILDEVQRNLSKKFRVPASTAVGIREFLRSRSEIVNPISIPQNACRDKSDLPILGTALASGAALMITGDQDLLELRVFRRVPILTPRQFWTFLRKAQL